MKAAWGGNDAWSNRGRQQRGNGEGMVKKFMQNPRGYIRSLLQGKQRYRVTRQNFLLRCLFFWETGNKERVNSWIRPARGEGRVCLNY